MVCPRCKNDTLNTIGNIGGAVRLCKSCTYSDLLDRNASTKRYTFYAGDFYCECYIDNLGYLGFFNTTRIWGPGMMTFTAQLSHLLPPDTTEDYIDKLLLLQ